MKKIMFNDKYGLTEAVLDGRKTQTRRVIGSGKIYDSLHDEIYNGELSEPYKELLIKKFSPYMVGEVVAVAQRYKDLMKDSFASNAVLQSKGYNNKMFVKAELMPHHIKITNIRVEKLQDISDEDCLKEGVQKVNFDIYVVDGIYVYDNGVEDGHYIFDTPRNAYAALIEKVSGRGTWDSNPYVFVYDFELVD